MAFEPGGRADKLGNRYEGRWITKQLLRLLSEEIRSVTVEAIGDDENGVDLWIENNDGVREAHQCKARNASKEKWTIADLNNRGILQHIRFQLDRDPAYQFVLVCGVPFTILKDICDSARNSSGIPSEFYKYQISNSGPRHKFFINFCNYLGLNPDNNDDLGKAYGYLRRIRVQLFQDDENSWGEILMLLGFMFSGKKEIVAETISAYIEDHNKMGSPIFADVLLEYLKSQGILPKNLSKDDRLLPAYKKLQDKFSESIKDFLINNSLIPRKETEKCLQAITNKGVIILHGAAGSGKSGVLFELTQKLVSDNIPYLPLRIDRDIPAGTAVHYGEAVGLPDSPANSLVTVAGNRPCVFILDQLDAVRWTTRHSASALDVCKELVSNVLTLQSKEKQISVILSCRTFDLENDPEIRAWLKNVNAKDRIEVKVGELPSTKVRDIIGEPYDRMSEHRQTILSNPQNLSMWTEIRNVKKLPDFRSSTELMKKYWAFQREQIEEKEGTTANEINSVLEELVDWLEKNGKVSAPASIISACSIKAIKALKSRGIIHEQYSKVIFGHQSYLDFFIAERLLRQIHSGGNFTDWLGPKERQTLFRREQLRQALTLLSDESPGDFLKALKEIFHSKNIRFHLKHLALELVGQMENISEKLVDYCLKLLDDEYWKDHINEAVFMGNASFLNILIDRGLIQRWLKTDDVTTHDRALMLLRSVAHKIPDQVTDQLIPFINEGKEWQEKILRAICWEMADDSEKMFTLRLQLLQAGTFDDYIYWESICKSHPLRALAFIEAYLSTISISMEEDNPYQRRSRMEEWYDEVFLSLSKVAAAYPEKTWELFIPHILRLTAFKASSYGSTLYKWYREEISDSSSMSIELSQGVVELSIIAGKKLIQKKTEEFLAHTRSPENTHSLIIQYILMKVYTELPGEYADDAIRWLLADLNRFESGFAWAQPVWKPAAGLIKALSPHCSEVLFRKLEHSIIHYHSQNEKELVKEYFGMRKKGVYHHYWGKAQYFLLPALPGSRISKTTADLITVLKRKFEVYTEKDFSTVNSSGTYWVGSKLDAKLGQISDNAWLKIIDNDKVPEDRAGYSLTQISEKEAVESSIMLFSRSLGKIAARFPERFGLLSLRFPKNVNSSYVSAILDAVSLTKPSSEVPREDTDSWKPASLNTVMAVLEKFSNLNTGDSAMSFCRLIKARASEKWSDHAIEFLLQIAVNHPDPSPGKLNVTNAGENFSSDGKSVDQIFSNSINCTRGTAAEAIAGLLWHHPTWFDKLRPAIEHLIDDCHPAVRMAAVNIILPIYNINREQAVDWFCRISKEDLRIPASHNSVHFLNYSIDNYYEQLKPIISRMVHSNLPEISQIGAKLSAAYFLFYGRFEEEVGECREGTVAQRKGVAGAIKDIIKDTKYSEKCREFLIPLLDDPDAEVRKNTVFSFKDDFLEFTENIKLVKQIVHSKSMPDYTHQIMRSLENLKGSIFPCAEIIFEICRQITTTLLEETKDQTTSFPFDLEQLSPLLLRLYEEASEEEPEIADKCLDAWDILYEHRVGITRKLTKDIEK